MTIQNVAGIYFATERDRENGGGFVGTGTTPTEAVCACMKIMSEWEPDERQLEEDAQYRNTL
ncbi:MAG TPA: hypothetical protein V6D19_13055 [Stenomitos sp.]